MRTNRLIATGAAVAACAALLFAAQPSAAGSAPRLTAPTTCVAAGSTGLYLSKAGEATMTFSPQFLDGLRKQGVTTQGVAPNTVVGGGSALRLPIGEKYDNIELPSGRVCYPGGMIWTKASTRTTYAVDDFWMKFAAVGNSKVFTTPKVNGATRAAGELNMANFSAAQALTAGEFSAHNNGVGPKRVTFTMDAEFARDLNEALGTDFKANMAWSTLDIAWSGAPTRALPSMKTPDLQGLSLFAEALKIPAGANAKHSSHSNSKAPGRASH
ncbi:hypothetical protein [Actinacidiphila oryziradicis]|uniref:hypothetical protein n=1 Tax=Actinacidiphila oryziradicis TaxID=2571141 RepID=UPI0023EF82FF|nr:hypothetical protein [Actinacidiphila oryziradicis]MCW2870873.1 hypothetical protein [Actinacidiphila oryziradicis]